MTPSTVAAADVITGRFVDAQRRINWRIFFSLSLSLPVASPFGITS